MYDQLNAKGTPSCTRRLLRLYSRINEAFEFFCVYCLMWANWLIAISFAAAYVCVLVFTFEGAQEGPDGGCR